MNKIYYKTVRPDMGSFYDPSFKWPETGSVEEPDADISAAECGKGLHLGITPESAIRYAKFPFRLFEARPLSSILGKSSDKIRIARAEVIRELPRPEWAKKVEKRIAGISDEMKNVPWFKGTDKKKASKLIRKHLNLLVPFGLKPGRNIEVVTSLAAARAARDAAYAATWATALAAAQAAARAVAQAAARDAAWDAAYAAAWGAAWDAAWDAARGAARGAARDAAWDAARAVVGPVAWDAARAAAWDAVEDKIAHENPFRPLWGCWEVGAWPIGFVGKDFIIYIGGKE
jgi:hypothetical protein